MMLEELPPSFFERWSSPGRSDEANRSQPLITFERSERTNERTRTFPSLGPSLQIATLGSFTASFLPPSPSLLSPLELFFGAGRGWRKGGGEVVGMATAVPRWSGGSGTACRKGDEVHQRPPPPPPPMPTTQRDEEEEEGKVLPSLPPSLFSLLPTL